MVDQIHQIFTEPQTCYKFLDKEVSNQSLDDLYDLLKWGPTSFNCSPMRLKFLKSKQAKENLSSNFGETYQRIIFGRMQSNILKMTQKNLKLLHLEIHQYREAIF